MLVQLRRVVYLLVLLQCCLSVCAEGTSQGVSEAKMGEVEKDLNELARVVDDLKVKVESCSKGLQGRAVSSKESVSTLTAAVEDAIRRIDEGGPMAPGSQAEKERLSRAWDAAQKAKKAAEKAKTVVSETDANITYCLEEADKLIRGTIDLEVAIDSHSKTSAESRNHGDGKNKDEKRYQESVDSGRQTVDKLTDAVNVAKNAMEKVKEELKSQEKSLEGIDRFFWSVPDRPIPLPAEEQPPSATENPNSLSEKEKVQSAVEGPRGTEGLQSNTHTNGMRETTENNTGNSQVHQDPEENVMGNVNASNGTKITGDVERDVGVQNTNEKPNETSTAAPGTVNTESSRVTSGSNSTSSSGTMHLNVSGLRDSSSSPALVHSPLLLLLLCVLGSILVC